MPFGILVCELLTSELPFTNLESSNPTEEYSGLVAHMLPNRRTDLASLIQYCQDKLDFPTQTLRSSNIQDDAIEFVKGLLAGGPQDRPTAISTLSNPWLTGADGCLTFQKISD